MKNNDERKINIFTWHIFSVLIHRKTFLEGVHFYYSIPHKSELDVCTWNIPTWGMSQPINCRRNANVSIAAKSFLQAAPSPHAHPLIPTGLKRGNTDKRVQLLKRKRNHWVTLKSTNLNCSTKCPNNPFSLLFGNTHRSYNINHQKWLSYWLELIYSIFHFNVS